MTARDRLVERACIEAAVRARIIDARTVARCAHPSAPSPDPRLAGVRERDPELARDVEDAIGRARARGLEPRVLVMSRGSVVLWVPEAGWSHEFDATPTPRPRRLRLRRRP